MKKYEFCALVGAFSIFGLGCGGGATDETSDPAEANQVGAVGRGNTNFVVGVEGVAIDVDGVSVGTTPATGTLNVHISPTHHQVRAKLTEKNGTIRIGTTCYDLTGNEAKPVNVEVKLGKKLCYNPNELILTGPGNTDFIVTKDGKPASGATVMVDGNYVGDTPSNGILNANISPGDHRVSVDLIGFAGVARYGAGDPTEVPIPLKPKP